MKRFPVLSILYYGFTVIIGIILAFYFFVYGTQLKVADTLRARANNNDAYGVTRLISGYQNSESVYEKTIDGVGTLGVYEAVTSYLTTIPDGDSTKSVTKLERGYMGVITNVGSEWKRSVYTDEDGKSFNHFGLRFNGVDKDGNSTSYDYRIGYLSTETYKDTQEANLYNNRYSSYEVSGFYYFMIGDVEFSEGGLTSITSFDFINNDESVLENKTQTLTTSWTLDTPFLNLVKDFEEKYNNLIDTNEITQDKVNAISDEFETVYSTYDKYTKSDFKDVTKNVNLFSVIKMIAYILIVWIVGDFLVGRHYILNFFRRLFGKNVQKVENVVEYQPKHELNTTVEADVPDNYKKEVTIKYISEEGSEVVFNLKPSNGYKETKLIMSGDYSHPEIIAEGLTCLDIPSILKVNGLTFTAKFIFERKKSINTNNEENK